MEEFVGGERRPGKGTQRDRFGGIAKRSRRKDVVLLAQEAQVVEMRYFGGVTAAEIASVLAVSTQSVKSEGRRRSTERLVRKCDRLRVYDYDAGEHRHSMLEVFTRWIPWRVRAGWTPLKYGRMPPE
jgi:hypothetical protein